MRVVVWLARAALFFALFAFALNNQQESAVRWFFGREWRAPMVYIVLSVFALGCAVGVFAMVPGWWHHRRLARLRRSATIDDRAASVSGTPPPQESAQHDGV
jgi:uncharacterized integral membrane protein